MRNLLSVGALLAALFAITACNRGNRSVTDQGVMTSGQYSSSSSATNDESIGSKVKTTAKKAGHKARHAVSKSSDEGAFGDRNDVQQNTVEQQPEQSVQSSSSSSMRESPKGVIPESERTAFQDRIQHRLDTIQSRIDELRDRRDKSTKDDRADLTAQINGFEYSKSLIDRDLNSLDSSQKGLDEWSPKFTTSLNSLETDVEQAEARFNRL